jgi:hypothetical protein
VPSSLIRHDVLPVGIGYLLLMAALGAGLRLARRRPGDASATGARPGPEAAPAARPAATAAAPRPGWLRLARHYAGTAIGGYLLLMAVVILYYYGVARVGGAFIVSAFTGCALLIALSTPVFALASWLTERRRARAPADRDPSTPSAP